MADGASLSAFISISISTHFVFQAEIKIIEAVPGRGSATPQAPLLCILTELPTSKPRTTYSCGSLVHQRGWLFCRLGGWVFFVFLKNLLYTLPRIFLDCVCKHIYQWALCSPCWPLGSSRRTLSVNFGNLRIVCKRRTLWALWAPEECP